MEVDEVPEARSRPNAADILLGALDRDHATLPAVDAMNLVIRLFLLYVELLLVLALPCIAVWTLRFGLGELKRWRQPPVVSPRRPRQTARAIPIAATPVRCVEVWLLCSLSLVLLVCYAILIVATVIDMLD